MVVNRKAILVVRFEKTCGGIMGYLQKDECFQKAKATRPQTPRHSGMIICGVNHGYGAPPVLIVTIRSIVEVVRSPDPNISIFFNSSASLT